MRKLRSRKFNIDSIRYGIFLVIAGTAIFIFGPVPHWGKTIESGYGLVFYAVGIAFIVSAILNRKKYSNYQKLKMKCSKCGEEYFKRSIVTPECVKCKGDLYDLNTDNSR